MEKNVDYDGIYAAVEKYRKTIPGLKALHVTPGPNATPENIVDELKKSQKQVDAYKALPEIWKLKWQVHHYETLLNNISDNVGLTMDEYNTTPETVKKKMSNIFNEIDFRSAIHSYEAVEFYEKNKDK